MDLFSVGLFSVGLFFRRTFFPTSVDSAVVTLASARHSPMSFAHDSKPHSRATAGVESIAGGGRPRHRLVCITAADSAVITSERSPLASRAVVKRCNACMQVTLIEYNCCSDSNQQMDLISININEQNEILLA